MQATASTQRNHLFSPIASSALSLSHPFVKASTLRIRNLATATVCMSLREDGPSVTVVGVTGAGGQEFLRVLSDLDFPYRSIRLLASRRSAGKQLTFEDRRYAVEELRPESFDGIDIVLFSAVPLLIPEVNPEAMAHIKIKGRSGKGALIANPNCSTIICLMAATPLHRHAKVIRVSAMMGFGFCAPHASGSMSPLRLGAPRASNNTGGFNNRFSRRFEIPVESTTVAPGEDLYFLAASGAVFLFCLQKSLVVRHRVVEEIGLKLVVDPSGVNHFHFLFVLRGDGAPAACGGGGVAAGRMYALFLGQRFCLFLEKHLLKNTALLLAISHVSLGFSFVCFVLHDSTWIPLAITNMYPAKMMLQWAHMTGSFDRWQSWVGIVCLWRTDLQGPLTGLLQGKASSAPGYYGELVKRFHS
ncbi:hypothetical protein ZIOFF_066521 [Zingiber officinale]|uniref:Semialdehyde dehydrogenase NAD-binding domain-containing protein n=1 Tax=Zingiber officinale TaxID=94328 RepID=A0A8J5F351_ZINOF|nr:hypothetical protein ZIOFF_066521 [Zingiber officinale]